MRKYIEPSFEKILETDVIVMSATVDPFGDDKIWEL